MAITTARARRASLTNVVACAITLSAICVSLSACNVQQGGANAQAVAQTELSAAESLGIDQVSSVWDGVYSSEQASRGEVAYVAHCATCHSIDLSGIDIAPGLKGAGFRFRWSGSSLNDIYLSLRSTMPQASPGSLSREVYVDLIAYLLEANNYPTGNLELTPDEALLDAIQVDRKPS